MTEFDAAKLLEMIQLSYPNAFRDKDAKWKKAAIRMWAYSFQDVPYPIMEQGFNRYRMTGKFPPTVAEMVEQLHRIYREAEDCCMIQQQVGNREAARQYQALMDCVRRYKEPERLGLEGIHNMVTGGGLDAGTLRDRMDRADGVPVLDAGNWA